MKRIVDWAIQRFSSAKYNTAMKGSTCSPATVGISLRTSVTPQGLHLLAEGSQLLVNCNQITFYRNVCP